VLPPPPPPPPPPLLLLLLLLLLSCSSVAFDSSMALGRPLASVSLASASCPMRACFSI
jgi:hypothetical protein